MRRGFSFKKHNGNNELLLHPSLISVTKKQSFIHYLFIIYL